MDRSAAHEADVSALAPRVSVLIPTHNQAAFIGRALAGLLAQQEERWEAIVVDDGSTDGTAEVVRPFLADPRVRYERLPENRGLGAALNHALSLATAACVSYLPSDDVFYPEHLGSLLALLDDEGVTLAYAGVRHHYYHETAGQIDGYPLQLVQVAHRRMADRWPEREELVTDDLERMYWSRLRGRGRVAGSGAVTCEWVDHPAQRHKLIRESLGGGINPYRLRYGVRRPLRYASSEGFAIDEVEHYQQFRARPDTPPARDGLTILLVGELSYNPERILALEERGHRLYGLWTTEGWWWNAVGPLPFGHVTDLPRDHWREAVRELKPDLIYALLNWQAVPFAHHVLKNNPGVPFVWHMKEGPQACIDRGTWPQLVDLLTRSDGQIYSTAEMRDWFAMALPGRVDHERTLVLDGDLAKREWFTEDRRAPLSTEDGAIHTVVTGRPLGVEPAMMAKLAAAGIHLHVYGMFGQGPRPAWVGEMERAAPDHVHLHGIIHQDRWVSELSRYDAGWLHLFRSRNGGDPRRMDWNDINLPARVGTMAAAGLPLIQHDNSGSIVAVQSLARQLDIGVFFDDIDDLRRQLADELLMASLREHMWRQREVFTLDHHADRLVEFFRRVIAS